MKLWICKILFGIILCLPSVVTKAQYIHSHNDYKQSRPFYGALNAKAYSIEVDVWGVGDKLYVAHERTEIRPEFTFESLYLEPLYALRSSEKIQLLIDLKTEAIPTLDLLISKLEKHPMLLQRTQIKFVISGKRPAPHLYNNYPDYIYFDHQNLDDLMDINLEKVALVSLPFWKISSWKGDTFLDPKDLEKIQSTLSRVHELGLPMRFWATPDNPIAWRTLQQLKVDFINTDNPTACAAVLNSYK